MGNKEIECRFLEVDKGALVNKLIELGAKDEGEIMLEETIVYDRDLKWPDERRFVRLRKAGDKTVMTYKEHQTHTVDGTFELEFAIGDYAKAELLLEKIGLRPFRHQQKKRHTFYLDGVTIDIDTWPRIPTYVELEGESEAALRAVALQLGLDWARVDLHNARWVIENVYKIPVSTLTWFTFDKYE